MSRDKKWLKVVKDCKLNTGEKKRFPLLSKRENPR